VAAGLVRLLASHGNGSSGRWPAGGAERRGSATTTLSRSRPEHGCLPYELTNPYCFAPAIARTSAREAGIAISVDALEDWYARATTGVDVAVVEGPAAGACPCIRRDS